MKTTRLALSALLLGATAVLVSCGESSPVSPRPRGLLPRASLSGYLAQVGENADLLDCSNLPDANVKQTIGPPGGVLNVGPHTLSVPAGALSDWVTISAVSGSNKKNGIKFKPEGLVFRKPASLTLSYATCDLFGSLAPKRITYIDDMVVILEKLPSVDDPRAQTVSAQLRHFSEYAVAW